MNAKMLFMIVLVFLPSVAQTQGVPSDQAAQDLFQFYRKNYIQNPASMNELDIFKDGTLRFGFINLSGTSTKTYTDLIGLAREIAGSVTFFFAIPPDYQWVLEQGGLAERPPVMTIGGDRRNVQFTLSIDGVPLEKAFVQIMVDMEGRLRSLVISMPRLRPEIVAAVRGALITPADAQARIQADANALPAANNFMITPGMPLKFVGLRKVALAEEPYIVYDCFVDAARYSVNAKTGAIFSRMSMLTP